jgi:hypothetical protein
MKGKKLIGLLLTAAMSVIMATGVFAGEFILDKNFHNTEGDHRIWCTSGTDNIETDMDITDFKTATQLVIEFNRDVENINLAWLGDGNSWGWVDTSIEVNGKTMTVDVKGLWDWGPALSGTNFKFFVSDYESSWDGLEVVSAKFIGDYAEAAPAAVEEAPAAAADEAPAAATAVASPRTGDSNMLILFGILFLIASAGLITLTAFKKQKNN